MRWSKLQSKFFCVSLDTVKESPTYCLRSDQCNFFDAVDFIQLDGNLFRLGCRNVLTDIIGFDRQFPVSSVDQDRDRDPFRSPEIHHRIHAGPDRAGGEQHIIHQGRHACRQPKTECSFRAAPGCHSCRGAHRRGTA